jgi:hypothetical protein
MKLRTILPATLLLLFLFLQPSSQAKHAALLTPRDTGPAASALAPRPDITSQHGITLGGAVGGAGGHFAAWDGVITLNASDAIVRAPGRCAFNASYDMENIGTVPTSPIFKNRLLIDTTNVVAINSGLSLNTGQTRQINTQPFLPSGCHIFTLSLDDDSDVCESNEKNNFPKVTVVVNCP